MPTSGAGSARQRDFLFVQSTTEVGGAETVLLNGFEASPELRRRALVVTLGFGQGDLPGRLRGLGVDVTELKMPRLRYAWRAVPVVAELRQVVAERGVRVVIGNGGHPQIVGGIVARLAGAKTVFVAHMIYPSPIWKNDPRDVIALMGPIDMILGVSHAAREAAAKLRPSVPTHLLHNGTLMREVSPSDAASARAELGVEPDQLLVGVFGRLQRWKGQDVFVKAAALVARQRPQARFAVVGGSVFGLEPEFLDGLQREVATSGLSDRLRFTGFRSDVPRLMAACDVVCHTTRVAEPFGLVVIEAMALARPVIATAGGGPSEIIEDESQGVLVPPDDPEALAREMIALLDDPQRRSRVGAAGRQRVDAHFSSEVAAAKLLALLEQAMAAG
jgi:glycosyltransferase involved in cell wall biosynthesis